MNRLSVPEYAIALASVAALRSEDPFRKVGAVALDHSNRVIGTAYNGLAPGYVAPPGFWDDRDARQKFMLHAEVNLCSLFVRGAAALVAVTTKPCTSCMQMLSAYGVKRIFYRDDYPASEAGVLADHYGIALTQIKCPIHIVRPTPGWSVISEPDPPMKRFIDWVTKLGYPCDLKLELAAKAEDIRFVYSSTQDLWEEFQSQGHRAFDGVPHFLSSERGTRAKT